MADEPTKHKVLHIFPCEPKDYNKGRCRMDTATMADLRLIIGSSVRIRTRRRYVYCSVWPRENVFGANVIQFDDLITLLLDKQNTDHALAAIPTQTLSIPGDICKLEAVEATYVVVSVFLKDIETRKSTLSKTLYDKQLERRVKIFIKGLTVTKGCVIKPRNSRNQSSLMNGLASITIEDTSSINGDGTNCTFVSDNSKIQVKSVKMAHSIDDDSRFAMAGLDEAAQMLREMLSYPFEYPECFAHIGLECPKGILLQGVPGVGKTLLVRNVTAECNAQLITLNGTDVFGPHTGESEENLRKSFDKAWLASKSGPCVLFVDEIDALCPKRGTSSNEEENRIVAQLLTLMDGIKSRGKLVVIGATNRPNAIDSALRRPGRFDREVVIGVPGALRRLAILKAHCKNFHLDKDVDLPYIAEVAIGYVGADLASLCREAAFTAMKRSLQEDSLYNKALQKDDDKDTCMLVKMSDFQLAICHIVPSTHRGMEGLVDVHPISWSNIGGLHEVKQALKQAALFALEEEITASIINHKHFQKALSTVRPSLTIEQLNYFKNW
ncbi:hypothetical protein QZH41_016166 [Actinostola sp. cb2023]|nr:hypothetical protein QZH41_016166 [Actinostola sp. cb2023]